MTRDLLLVGVGSDGSIKKWDGGTAPRGIMLRWFLGKGLDFPYYGFDLYRADVPDYARIATKPAFRRDRHHPRKSRPR